MAGTTAETQSTQTRFRDKVMDKHDIPILGNFYTKKEVDAMVAEAIEEARTKIQEGIFHEWKNKMVVKLVQRL